MCVSVRSGAAPRRRVRVFPLSCKRCVVETRNCMPRNPVALSESFKCMLESPSTFGIDFRFPTSHEAFITNPAEIFYPKAGSQSAHCLRTPCRETAFVRRQKKTRADGSLTLKVAEKIFLDDSLLKIERKFACGLSSSSKSN